jgi:hypothetical protein
MHREPWSRTHCSRQSRRCLHSRPPLAGPFEEIPTQASPIWAGGLIHRLLPTSDILQSLGSRPPLLGPGPAILQSPPRAIRHSSQSESVEELLKTPDHLWLSNKPPPLPRNQADMILAAADGDLDRRDADGPKGEKAPS